MAKPKLGFVSFTCCQGCQFTVLFVDKLLELLEHFDVEYFHLLKEKNREAEFDLMFVEGAITTKREAEKLKRIRKQSKYLVSLGACACHGGIPAMRNFLEEKELGKYVYNQKMLDDSIEAQPISNFIKVDYFMYGCPIIKEEFERFMENYLAKRENKEFEGSVCDQCPRRGKDCYLRNKTVCLGAVTNGGCNALCIRNNIPCILCRGPTETANFGAEINLFKNFGLSEKDILSKINRFKNIEVKNAKEKN